ncbi:MAG: hypothetical protein L6Q98_14100 [Anaerolineae bacterium]|nr:hypothetical protein [Anaerolineae bacterium]NUQ03353.1 hypothetical protein [Anaerolineae bacterium]
MNQWSFASNKLYQEEMLRRAQTERIASSVSPEPSGGLPHAVAAWVGERLIQVGERLTASARASMQTDGGDYLLAECAR